MEIVGTAFLGCMMVSLVIPAVAESPKLACSLFIAGRGQDVGGDLQTDCCICRELTSETCNVTVEEFCFIELLLRNNTPQCCPCTGGGWPGCMSPQNKERLIKLFKIHDKLVELLNSGILDDTSQVLSSSSSLKDFCLHLGITNLEKSWIRLLHRLGHIRDHVANETKIIIDAAKQN